MSRLAFPPVASPHASVVVVVHNAWEWTSRALQALIDNTPPWYEVIVVDNASTDGTADGLGTLENAVVIRNARNHGFGPAANQGAGCARAPFLVFLNSDALVHAGWLEPLLAVVESERDVAAVGARLLNLDGTLQEAGSIVWRDGSVTNYGDGDDPDRSEYSFRRDVDYASAACLLVRRSAFVDSGGFDPAYAPAYLEDVDLCFSFTEAGMRIVYQPRSVVTHVRWASGDRDATRSLIARNLPRFLARWHDALAHRPPYPGDHTRRLLLNARDSSNVERVLVVELPASGRLPVDGADIAGAIRRRWPAARVTLVGCGAADERDPDLCAAGVEVERLAAPADLVPWLEGRRSHYSMVLLREATADLLAAAAEAQPHARLGVCCDDAGGLTTVRVLDRSDAGATITPAAAAGRAVSLEQAVAAAGLWTPEVAASPDSRTASVGTPA